MSMLHLVALALLRVVEASNVLALIGSSLTVISFILMITLSTKHPKCTLACDKCAVWAQYHGVFFNLGKQGIVRQWSVIHRAHCCLSSASCKSPGSGLLSAENPFLVV